MPDVYDEELDNTSGPLLGESNDTTRSSPSVTKVKLTGYRLLNMAVIFIFGMVKAVLTYLGQSAAPTTIDWVAGVVLTLALYYIGLHESEHPPNWDCFFDDDLSHLVIYYCIRLTIIFLASLASWLLLVILFPYGLILYVVALSPILISAIGHNVFSITVFMLFNAMLSIIGYRLFQLISRRSLIRHPVRTAWHYVSRGQSNPNRFPWWLDLFTLVSSGALAFFIQVHWLHDFLSDAISHVANNATSD